MAEIFSEEDVNEEVLEEDTEVSNVFKEINIAKISTSL